MKWLFWCLGAAAVLAVVFVVLYTDTKQEPSGINVPPEKRDDAHMLRYTDGALGFGFTYRDDPDGYYLFEAERGTNDPEDLVHTITLTVKSEHDELLRATSPREGPPTIVMYVFQDGEDASLRAWAETNARTSNIQLIRGDVTDTTIAGADAIRYESDGLYLFDNVIFRHENHTFLISGAYHDENSRTRRDFQPLLDSLTLTQVPR
jgi:hypothetical protein